ncbi:hypothetical protein [Chelativorans sp. M5D2P16]|uniref:hypothetical protein n=1 Tax=Chelativorans sp. M5D2P16 TaxID=3095678 RepID=UPI002ACB020E|nr:hypothetical protein [Chelativorans sp. M5D2P16]MDZ5698332.1 hypothetical protein [Chelativorans sp. M5D2P16]
MTDTLSQVSRAAPRALVFLSLLMLPVIAMGSVHGGEEDIIAGSYKASNGAGLVLVISLKRAR